MSVLRYIKEMVLAYIRHVDNVIEQYHKARRAKRDELRARYGLAPIKRIPKRKTQ